MERIDQCVASLGRGPERALDDGGYLIVIDCPGSPGTSLIQQSFNAILQKASAPFADRVLMEADFARNGFAWNAIRASQDDATAFGQRPRHAMATNLSFKIRSFIRTQDQRSNRTPRRVGHSLAPALMRKSDLT
jgi:hypothetical protein